MTGRCSTSARPADYHRVVQLFKPLYPARWLSTGGSKGGMSVVYHRYFYPDDVDVTLPYVAPNSHGLNDVRYAKFIEAREPACTARLHAFQQDVLRRREEMMPFMEELVFSWGTGFNVIGGLDRALEFSAVELSFYFWQYGDASLCELIPAPGAPAADAFAFLDGIVTIAFTYGDVYLNYYAAYYYQSATELGWTRFPTQHLHGLLRYPGEDEPRSYLAFPVTKRFDMDLMLRVEHWVRDHGKRMLFIYGENDPWSAHVFSVRERNDSFRFYAPGGNHNAGLRDLAGADRAFAVQKLFEWMDVSAPAVGTLAPELAPEPEADEPRAPRLRL
jgi:hypothetical protein